MPQFLTSLAIGLLIGLERERNPSAKAGLRTFALVPCSALLLALLADKIGYSLAGDCRLARHRRHHHRCLSQRCPGEINDPGTTTVIALLLSYSLGVTGLVRLLQARRHAGHRHHHPALLQARIARHDASAHRRDLVSILQFSVLSFVILPILPDQNYGPYEAFNPHQAWMMVVLISGLSLAGYVALRWTGRRYGAPLLGFFGGLVSSTATTLVYAKHSKLNDGMLRLSAVVILIASQVVLVRLMVVSGIISPGIFRQLAPVMGLGLLFGLDRHLVQLETAKEPGELPMPETANPTEIHAALTFGLLFVVVLFCSAWLSDVAGSGGLYIVAIVSGLTDVDAIALSSLRLFHMDKLSSVQTVTSISLAFLSNMLFKFGMAASIGGLTLAKHIAVGFLAIASVSRLACFSFDR